MFHFHPPFPLTHSSPIPAMATLSAWRAADPVVVVIILSYILRAICIRGLKPGFEMCIHEMNLLLRPTGLKGMRGKGVGTERCKERKRLKIDANQGLPIFLSLSV